MNPIYLDYNATTPIDKEVADAMLPFLSTHFGNPSSTHSYGIKARQAVTKARRQIANFINCNPDEIIFTSGGTESNNYAIKGAALANRNKGNHIITSRIEHPAVIEVCQYLEKHDFEVTYLEVDGNGRIAMEDVANALRSSTILISVMHANNEVGTIQPIKEIGEIARKKQVLFHTDAAQSLGKIKADVQELQVDLLSVAGHKIYAPKGVGALYIRKGTMLEKLIHGADHEMNLRAGTENVLEVVGLGKACEIAGTSFEENTKHMLKMRDSLEQGVLKHIPEAMVNGHATERLPNTASISFPKIEANTMLSKMQEVAASAGAACHTGSIDISSVLKAMRIPEEVAMGTIRFSTGKYTTQQEIKEAVARIIRIVNKRVGKKNPD
jgi:cysteine desulfurase NifS